MTRRLDPYEHPLVLQNEYLSKIGFHDVYRIQKEGLSVELGYLIRFYSGSLQILTNNRVGWIKALSLDALATVVISFIPSMFTQCLVYCRVYIYLCVE